MAKKKTTKTEQRDPITILADKITFATMEVFVKDIAPIPLDNTQGMSKVRDVVKKVLHEHGMVALLASAHKD